MKDSEHNKWLTSRADVWLWLAITYGLVIGALVLGIIAVVIVL